MLVVLGACDGAGPVARLEERLASGTEDEKKSAIREIAELGPGAARAVPALVRVLPDPALRFPAMASLGRIGRSAVPGLVEVFDNPSLGPHVRAVLETMGESVLPDMVRLARGSRGTQRRRAIAAMLVLGPSATHGLLQLARDPELRPAVATGLQNLEVPHLRALLAALTEAPEDVRRFVIPRVWRDAPVEGEPKPLDLAAGLADPAERAGTAISLAAMGPRILPQLLPMLSVDALREGAAHALALMGPSILPQLRAALADPEQRALHPRIREVVATISR